MRTSFVLMALLIQAASLAAQPADLKIPMTPERWEAEPGRAAFITHQSVPAMRIQGEDQDDMFESPAHVVLKDLDFSDGVIKFDVELTEYPFAVIYFRRADALNADMLYLRTYRVDDPTGPDAVQYTAVTKGVPLWDLHPRFQGPAVLHRDAWNHVKLVISGEQMQVYVNSATEPTLVIPKLAGGASHGRIAFEGSATFANLVITPGEPADLPPTAGFDPARYDPRYLRSWHVSEPIPLPPGQELVSAAGYAIYSDHLPSDETAWKRVEAEYDGLVNLNRHFGLSEGQRSGWLKTTVHTEADQLRRMNLGFSDEVWVLLNGRLVYVDKNLYGHPIMKDPFGQISIDDASFALPLQAGENEVLIGVANSFFGWAIMARLDNMAGLTVD